MDAHFSGVSLGVGLSGSQTWADDLDVSIGDNGITVAGDENAPASTVPWSAVKHFAPGFTLVFPNGRPATELEVRLADRELNFLIPADQLDADLVAQLVRIAPESAGQSDSGMAQRTKTAGQITSKGTAAVGRAGANPKDPKNPKSPKGRPSGKRLLVAAVGVVVVIAVVTGVTLGSSASSKPGASSTTTTTRVTSGKTTASTVSPVPTRELPGPPDSVAPATALVDVLIHASDLHSWKAAYANTQDYPGQPQADADTDFDPFVPSASSVLEPSFGILQQCSNLSLTHIQLLTGNYYAGGPPTWSSATFYPSNENLTQQSVTPQLYSIASLVASVADQKTDFAAMASPGFGSCLSSYFSSNLRAAFGQQGYSVDSLSVSAEPVSTIPGVETLKFLLSGELIEAGDVFEFRNTIVFMGAGRLEQMVSGYDSTDQPIPSGTWRILLANLQHRMKVIASKR